MVSGFTSRSNFLSSTQRREMRSELGSNPGSQTSPGWRGSLEKGATVLPQVGAAACHLALSGDVGRGPPVLSESAPRTWASCMCPVTTCLSLGPRLPLCLLEPLTCPGDEDTRTRLSQMWQPACLMTLSVTGLSVPVRHTQRWPHTRALAVRHNYLTALAGCPAHRVTTPSCGPRGPPRPSCQLGPRRTQHPPLEP